MILSHVARNWSRPSVLFGGLAKLSARRQRTIAGAVHKLTRLRQASGWVLRFTDQQPLLRTGPLWGELIAFMVRYPAAENDNEAGAATEARRTGPKSAPDRQQLSPTRPGRSTKARAGPDWAGDEKTLSHGGVGERSRVRNTKQDFAVAYSLVDSLIDSKVKPAPPSAREVGREQLRKWAGNLRIGAAPVGPRRGVQQVWNLPARKRVSPPVDEPQQQSEWRQRLVARTDKKLRWATQTSLTAVQSPVEDAVELSPTQSAPAATPAIQSSWRRTVAGPAAPHQLLVAVAASVDSPGAVDGRKAAGSPNLLARQLGDIRSGPGQTNPNPARATLAHAARHGQSAGSQPEQIARQRTEMPAVGSAGEQLAKDALRPLDAMAEVDRDQAALGLAAPADGAYRFAQADGAYRSAQAGWSQVDEPPLLNARGQPEGIQAIDRLHRDGEPGATASPEIHRRATAQSTAGQQEWALHQLADQMKRILDAEARRHGIDV